MNNTTDPKLVKQELEVKTLRRRAFLDKVEDFIGFAATKGTGGVFLCAGMLELLSPDVLAVVLSDPTGFAGVGLALLTGKKTAMKLLNALRKAME